jgi:hypothetical protein
MREFPLNPANGPATPSSLGKDGSSLHCSSSLAYPLPEQKNKLMHTSHKFLIKAIFSLELIFGKKYVNNSFCLFNSCQVQGNQR